ncbi:hypothetical protein [Streptomyces sp. NRRL S-813]|uniref:phage tail tube protein n=1 Tax=Streptomyces sp. NRRL S-813 TaxID=1463919 RepID=UPI0004C0C76E|nr:hypothetical protein [Streptomyces sp. NRRL S-813]
MSVTTTNLIQGPASLYSGAVGATEPTDTAINTTPAASTWTDLGGTQDGVKLSVDQTYSELEVDQITLRVGSRLTKQDFTIETSLAEATLENLSLVLNGGTSASGAGFKSFDPNVTSSATQPNYFALILDGYAPNQFRRRIIGRRMLNTDSVELAYTKDKQTLIPAKFSGHYVSASVTPFHIVDQTS